MILKILLFTLLVPGTVTVYLPYRILHGLGGELPTVGGWLMWPGMLGLLAGLVIYLRCAWDFAVDGLGTPAPLDPPKSLVVSGLYRYSRNPMYLGVLLMLLGECSVFGGAALLVYTLVVASLLQCLVVLYEEPLLRKRFGDDYGCYCQQVPRWGW